MPMVDQILQQKGSHVHAIGTGASVLDAAVVKNEHKIGALVVLDEGRVVGIFTERDVLRRVVVEGSAPEKTHVGDVMTTEVACCRSLTKIAEARSVMKNRRIRHLPVVNEDSVLEGMISIGDLNAFEADEQELTIHFLHEYLYGRA